jgi:hypothetical protein
MEESFAAEKDMLDVGAIAAHLRVGTVTIDAGALRQA